MLRGIILGIIALLCATPAFAEDFQSTIYSDGASCPGNCDAHVVFHRSHNGTKFASLPSSPRSSPVACKVGEPCRICFDDRDSSCMDVLYRGNGPDKERFDFTPAFYEAACPMAAPTDRSTHRDRHTSCDTGLPGKATTAGPDCDTPTHSG